VQGLEELCPRLWRWTAPHPDWRPSPPGSSGDWDRDVGCVLYETDGAAVFFDPLLPPAPARFWRELDRRVRGKERVVVLTTIGWHRRSRDAIAERYRATTSRAKASLPAGIESLPIRGAGETMFWLPEHRALIPGDRILGGERGGLRLCPDSWLEYLPSGIKRAQLAELLRPLLDLPIELVLVSHGKPVLRRGRASLERALRQAPSAA
jgi:hypothetical protein